MSAIAQTAVLMLAGALVTASARAQDLDRDKSGAKLFAASCVQCHKSAHGLAKGRLSFTLAYYLRQHYTSSAGSAQTLTAYLQSLDRPRGKGKATARPPAAAAITNPAAPRPPALVPAGR